MNRVCEIAEDLIWYATRPPVVLVAVLLLVAMSVFAQEAKPVETADLRLTKTEQMEWENIQLKGGNIKRQIEDLQVAMKQLEAQLADLNKRVLEVRKLDGKEFTPNFQAAPPMVVKVQPKPPEPAKK